MIELPTSSMLDPPLEMKIIMRCDYISPPELCLGVGSILRNESNDVITSLLCPMCQGNIPNFLGIFLANGAMLFFISSNLSGGKEQILTSMCVM